MTVDQLTRRLAVIAITLGVVAFCIIPAVRIAARVINLN